MGQRARRCVFIVVAAAAVATGCGGGGSSGGGGVTPGGPTGLVPAAPTLGAVLYAQAAPLRPLLAGSKWVYHDHDYTIGNTTTTTIVQTAGAGGAVIEFDQAFPSDTTTLSLDPVSGSVQFSAPFVLGPGAAPFTVNSLELRSPVRQNDQIVFVDRRVANSGIDVDGDNRLDAVDIGGWRTVVGNESITLQNSSAPVTALRVDTALVLRFIPSGGGPAVTASTEGSTWYVAGVGVVRDTTDSTSSTRPLDDDTVLLGYDGVTHGYGYLTQPMVRLPGTIDPVQKVLVAVPLADGALLAGQAMYRVDRNGLIQASNPITLQMRALLRLDAGVRAFTGSFPTQQIYAMTDDGAVIGAAPIATVDVSNGRPGTNEVDVEAAIGAAPGSTQFWWVFWRNYMTGQPGQSAVEIVVRAFDASGAAMTGEIRLPIADTADSTTIRLATWLDGAAVSWGEYTTQAINRTVRLRNDGTIVYDSTLPAQSTTTVFARYATPLVDENRLWLVWNGPAAMSTTEVPHGLTIDAAGNAVGTGIDPASIDAATVDAIDADLAPGWGTQRFAAKGGRWFGAGNGVASLFADETAVQFLAFSEFDAGTGAAHDATPVSKFRIPLQPLDLPPIPFDDRVLLLSHDGFYFLPTVIWRQ